MPIKAYIVGQGGRPLKINGEGEISVSIHTHPPTDEEHESLPFRQYFTTTGISTGSNDMQVAGSLAAPIDFYITASPDYDIFIKTISIEIADAGATLSKFGNISALTNGVKMFWFTQKYADTEIHEGLKTNWDFVRLCGGQPAFGTATFSFIASNVSGTSEGLIPIMNVVDVFGLPWGFRLTKGTTDKIVFRVQDNTTGVDEFNIIGYGIKI